MAKKSFPGRKSQAKIKTKITVQREFNTKIGPAARIAIARRGLATFAAWAMLGIGLGSLDWYLDRDEQNISYSDAFKRAYNIKNVTNENAKYAVPAMILLALAFVMAASVANRDRRNAETLVRPLERARATDVKSDCYDEVLEKLISIYSSTPIRLIDKMDPVYRAVIEKYAAENPAMFEHILANDPGYSLTHDYAMTVAGAHLKKHPADYQKLLDTYDETSLPRALVRKYGKEKQR